MLDLARAGATGLLVLLAASCRSVPAQETIATAPAKTHIEFAHGVITPLRVRNLVAAKKWYGEMLGCGLVDERPGEGWCELSTPVDGAAIGLTQVPEGETVGPSSGPSLAFAVTHVWQARQSLIAAGVEIGQCIDAPAGVLLLELSDPDGNKLVLYQTPPPSPPGPLGR